MTESTNEGQNSSDMMGHELSIYEVMTERRTTYDILMWQAPVLSLTAQAFLFTIALGGGNSRVARFMSAGLALISALGSMHLMAKHRFSGNVDNKLLQGYESRNGFTRILGTGMHGGLEERARAAKLGLSEVCQAILI